MPTPAAVEHVRAWLELPPFDDDKRLAEAPSFSYESWLQGGRELPGVAEVLASILMAEFPSPTSQLAYRAAYALGWLGNDGALSALRSALKSPLVIVRAEAIAALGRRRDTASFALIAERLNATDEDQNVRGNACIAIGNLPEPRSEAALRKAAGDPDPFVAQCAQEGLRILSGEPPAPR